MVPQVGRVLRVPGANPRASLDGLFYTTAPNSPETKAVKITNSSIPGMGLDSSPKSRPTSPTRGILSRARSRIRPFGGRERLTDEDLPNIITLNSSNEQTPDSPNTSEARKRSKSPVKKITSRTTDDGRRPTKKSGSIRRGKGEESGIRGLFKGARNPVARVSDFLWKKESSPGAGTSSGISTDESDVEDIRGSQLKTEKKGSRESSAGAKLADVVEASPEKEQPSSLNNMPPYSSPSERRGRTTQTKAEETSSEPILSSLLRTREERRKSSRAYLLRTTPRIDVQNASPTSSPDLGPVDRFHRDSSISEFESRRGSSPGVRTADARLNAILGLPGKRRNDLPVTGLSSLETTNMSRPSLGANRQWSISDQGVSEHRGPMTKREIARVRALLLSSGIKAKEISRRAAETNDLRKDTKSPYADIANLAKDEIKPVPKGQEHRLAARILSEDIQLSSRMWQASADLFCNTHDCQYDYAHPGSAS